VDFSLVIFSTVTRQDRIELLLVNKHFFEPRISVRQQMHLRVPTVVKDGGDDNSSSEPIHSFVSKQNFTGLTAVEKLW
jgi:hypothetical protein